MDSRHAVEMYNLLEKQDEALMEAYRSMSHELRRLQVEEEMLMRKFKELGSAQALTEKDKNGENLSDKEGNGSVDHLAIKPTQLKLN